jgi:hypothetical protein
MPPCLFQATIVVLLVLILAVNIATVLANRRYLRRVGRATWDHDGSVAASTASIHAGIVAYHQNHYVIAHIQALAHDQGATPAISYRLACLARKVQPVFHGGMRTTVICTVAVGEKYRKIVAPCVDSHRRYAERHRIGYAVLEEAPPSVNRPPAWLKLPLLLHLFESGAERVLFIDADAMITDMDFTIEDKFAALERSQKLFLMTEDRNGLNSGVMFIINRSAAKRMLDLIWLYDADIRNTTWEQNAMQFLMSTLPEFAQYIDLDPRSKNFNSLADVWSEDDFICHFAGIRGQALRRAIQEHDKAISRARRTKPHTFEPVRQIIMRRVMRLAR